MKAAIDFIRLFIEQEYKSLVVAQSERDVNKFFSTIEALSSYCVPGLALAFVQRPYKPADDWFKNEEDASKIWQRRKLFQIKRYEYSAYGDIFRCYVSDTVAGKDTCFSCLYVARVEENLKVISKYSIDFEGGWDYQGGIELDRLGDLVEVQKLASPSWPDYMKVYEAEFVDA